MNFQHFIFVMVIFAGGSFGQTASAQQEQIELKHLAKARVLFERITGTKTRSTDPLVQEMAILVSKGDQKAAIEKAMQHPNFLNLTVKQMASIMSIRDETIRTRLNDFSATFIGVTRDDLDARTLLSGNFYYKADPARVPASVRHNIGPDVLNSNNHYLDIDNGKIDLGQVLTRVNGQQVVQAIKDDVYTLANNPDPAGVLTSRTFLTQHAIAGTNRRPVEFTFREFMCVAIDDWADTSASDIHIGPDIDRAPGDDHSKFQTNCKGCHTQMDSLRIAFSYWDASGTRTRNGEINPFGGGSKVADKYRRNIAVYGPGFIPKNNIWTNNSLGNGNATLFGWRGNNVKSGTGVRDLGIMIGNSKRFSLCMAKRVVETTCKKTVDIKTERNQLQKLADHFESTGYKFKELFSEAALSPLCES